MPDSLIQKFSNIRRQTFLPSHKHVVIFSTNLILPVFRDVTFREKMHQFLRVLRPNLLLLGLLELKLLIDQPKQTQKITKGVTLQTT